MNAKIEKLADVTSWVGSLEDCLLNVRSLRLVLVCARKFHRITLELGSRSTGNGVGFARLTTGVPVVLDFNIPDPGPEEADLAGIYVLRDEQQSR